MASFLTWFSGVVQDGLVAVTGGSIFMMFTLGLLGFCLFLWRFQVSMPFALMSAFFVLGVATLTFSNPFDAVLGSISIVHVLSGTLILMTGFLTWHLLFKKSGAGQG